MAIISKPNTFSTGATIIAAEHNANFDTIYNDYNGNIENVNISATAAITDGKLAQITSAQKISAGAITGGANTKGDVLQFDTTGYVKLVAGSSGTCLRANGAGVSLTWGHPDNLSFTGTNKDLLYFSTTSGSWTNGSFSTIMGVIDYFETDGTCIIAFDNYTNGVSDLSTVRNAVTLTSLADADLVDGKVSGKCYNYDGTNDYALVAHSASQAGSGALTMEAWIYPDTLTGTDNIICNQTNTYIQLSMNSTVLAGQIVTGTGTEAWSVSHGITTGAWWYVVVAWDNTGKAQVYVNGVLVGEGDDAGNGTVSDSAGGVYIGCDSGGANPFDGKIDGARVLRRKMSATEVLNRYNRFR